MEPTGPSRDDDGTAQLSVPSLNTTDYLKAEPKLTIEEKSALATGLASALNAHAGEAAHFTEAEAILRLLIWNAEPRVVEAVGKAVASNPHAPKSLAWALANDDEAAALPVLEACAVFSDDDLVAIVQASGNFSKMSAIARRSIVSEQISRSLVQHGDESTMQSLLANAKAIISDDAFGEMLDRFGERADVQESVANRESLSPSIMRRLVESANTDVAEKLARRHQVPQTRAVQLPGYLDEDSSEEEMDRQVSKFLVQKYLSESLLNQICQGNFDFVCRALAALTGTPKNEVCARILESPSAHLPEYWEKGSLSPEWLPVACAAASALIHIDQNYSKADRQLFSRNIFDRAAATLKAEKAVLTDAQKRFFFRRGR